MALERMGNLKFKVIAYRKLQEIMNAGALGCELRISGKLPSERAKSWRFAEGYLKKAGESRKEIDRAETTALTKTGIIGIKVAIMDPRARIYDRIDIDDELKACINGEVIGEEKEEAKDSKKTKKAKKDVKEMAKKTKSKATEKSNLMEKGELKVVKEDDKNVIAESPNEDIKPEEDGTAMQIAEELEEGVPAEQIDKDIKKMTEKPEDKTDAKVNKEKKTE